MSRVFVTQQPRANNKGWVPNLTPANRYGTIHYVFGASDYPSSDPVGSMMTAISVLEDFDPNRDYLLWPNTGDPGAMIAVMAVLARKGIDQIRFLNWERKLTRGGERQIRQGFYTPITFHLPTILN